MDDRRVSRFTAIDKSTLGTRLVAAATGAAAGTASGIVIVDGAVVAIGLGVVLAVAVLGVARSLAPRDERWTAIRLAALTFAVHVAAAVVLHAGSVALGRGGFITGDDHGYATVAMCLERYVRGEPLPLCVPPYWGGNAYLMGTWVYIEAALFLALGGDVLLPKLLNAALAAFTALLAWDTSRRVFGSRSALLAGAGVALSPSLILWSALNLKDTLAIFLITLVFWCLVRFQLRPSVWWLVATFAILLPIESVRRYIYVAIALLVPLGVALAQPLPRRWLWVGGASGVTVLLVATAQVGFALGPGLLAAAEGSRGAMAVGARTAFGDTFVVPAVPPNGAPQVTGAPRTITVASETRVIVSTSPRPLVPEPDSSGVAVVYPGDTVVVRKAAPTSEDTLALRTLAYLPTGLGYALFAPTPWSHTRALDLLTIPDMLIWYLMLGASLVTMWRERSHLRYWACLMLFAGGLLLLLSLVEGNVGTLYRHRAMAIPTLMILASPSIAAMSARLNRGFQVTRIA